MRQLCSLLLFVSLFFGCSVKLPTLQEKQNESERLTHLLVSLSRDIDRSEAKDLAKSSIDYSYELSHRYKVIASPWLQNALVNMGIKKRGLCHEWTEDLLYFLVKRNYRTFTFHTITANEGYYNEHNALSVSKKGGSLKHSIVLDAWRNSGKLYFIELTKDTKYEWKERDGLYGILPPK